MLCLTVDSVPLCSSFHWEFGHSSSLGYNYQSKKGKTEPHRKLIQPKYVCRNNLRTYTFKSMLGMFLPLVCTQSPTHQTHRGGWSLKSWIMLKFNDLFMQWQSRWPAIISNLVWGAGVRRLSSCRLSRLVP